jgi:hypothetical protein
MILMFVLVDPARSGNGCPQSQIHTDLTVFAEFDTDSQAAEKSGESQPAVTSSYLLRLLKVNHPLLKGEIRRRDEEDTNQSQKWQIVSISKVPEYLHSFIGI